MITIESPSVPDAAAWADDPDDWADVIHIHRFDNPDVALCGFDLTDGIVVDYADPEDECIVCVELDKAERARWAERDRG